LVGSNFNLDAAIAFARISPLSILANSGQTQNNQSSKALSDRDARWIATMHIGYSYCHHFSHPAYARRRFAAS
jgi:hypothetical protein